MTIDKATPQDMLSIQLDDRALFLERWRELLLESTRRRSVHWRAQREFRDLIDT